MILGVILRVLVCYVMIWMRVCLVDCVDPTTLFSVVTILAYASLLAYNGLP
jgi:hypothetical protein